jgi:hypothetical protein
MKLPVLTIKFITIITAIFLFGLCCLYFTFAVFMIYFHGVETQTTFRGVILTFIDSLETHTGSIRELVLALVAGILYVSAAILVKRSGDKLVATADRNPIQKIFKALYISLAWAIAGVMLFSPWLDLLNRLLI